MRFTDCLTERSIRPHLRAGDWEGVLREMAEVLAAQTGVPAATLEARLVERERTATTAVGLGVAMPHCRVPGLGRITAAVGVHPGGVRFGSPDGLPVRLVVALVSPPHQASLHLKLLARAAALLRNGSLRELLLRAPDGATARALLEEAEEAYVAGRFPAVGAAHPR